MKLKILVPIALVCIGAGLYGLSSNYFAKNNQNVAIPDTPEQDSALASVYVVKSPIKRGELISKSSLEVKRVPEEQALKMGIDTAQPLTLPAGGVAIQDMAEGETLSPATMLSPDELGYIDTVLAPNRVPYAIKVNDTDIVGGLITHGTMVDVVALSSEQQNLANDETVSGYQSVSISPVLIAVKVLKVSKETKEETRDQDAATTVTLILELSQRQVAKLAIAKNITQLEVHKSLGLQEASELQANSGDVLPDYRAIVEFRANEVTVK
ncbi:Flp pilus assembly protein CpaB [Vibrio intestinalis]|uniref:Flp pilus assembly protein CpaB n=1 Tax=Vibrio intestinalis TaxID=2933291 RepID=UPI0021A6723B|nr:Flp pilus assembly protein CpaB [Vibrio intestinalis]